MLVLSIGLFLGDECQSKADEPGSTEGRRIRADFTSPAVAANPPIDFVRKVFPDLDQVRGVIPHYGVFYKQISIQVRWNEDDETEFHQYFLPVGYYYCFTRLYPDGDGRWDYGYDNFSHDPYAFATWVGPQGNPLDEKRSRLTLYVILVGYSGETTKELQDYCLYKEKETFRAYTHGVFPNSGDGMTVTTPLIPPR